MRPLVISTAGRNLFRTRAGHEQRIGQPAAVGKHFISCDRKDGRDLLRLRLAIDRLELVATLAAHVLGRATAVGVMASLPYAGDAGQAKVKPLATAVPWSTAAVALLIAGLLIATVGALVPGRWLAAATAAVGVALIMRRWLRVRLGGYTGDTLGASEQLAEVAVLMALAVP